MSRLFDRQPPDGHIPAAYEIQVCDEGNKMRALQMLDKSNVPYCISVRKGQFYLQFDNMEKFTLGKRVLDQTLDMDKESALLGIAQDVTPVSTNTPAVPVASPTVAVKEETVVEAAPVPTDHTIQLAFKEDGADEYQWEIFERAYKLGYKEGYGDGESRASSDAAWVINADRQ